MTKRSMALILLHIKKQSPKPQLQLWSKTALHDHCSETSRKEGGEEDFFSLLFTVNLLGVFSRKEVKQKKKTPNPNQQHACLMLMPNALEKLLKSSSALK